MDGYMEMLARNGFALARAHVSDPAHWKMWHRCCLLIDARPAYFGPWPGSRRGGTPKNRLHEAKTGPRRGTSVDFLELSRAACRLLALGYFIVPSHPVPVAKMEVALTVPVLVYQAQQPPEASKV